MKTLVSIIITVYNKEKYLVDALESVLGQTLQEIEIICIDDGSTDLSGKILDEYEKRDKRIRVIHKENEGQVKSQKIGVFCARGAYIGFVDADDWIDSDMYKVLYEEMSNNDLDFISSGIIRKDRIDYDCAQEGIYQGQGAFRKLLDNLFWNNGTEKANIIGNAVTKLYRTDILRESCKEIPECVHYREDDCFVYSYVVRCKSAKILHKAFYHYRILESSDSNKVDELFFCRINHFYLFLKKEFSKSPYSVILIPQLDHYMARTLVEGINFKAGLGLSAYTNIKYPLLDKKRVAVYGAGTCGKTIIDKVLESDFHELIAVFDRNWMEKEERYKVYPIEHMREVEFDVVVIAIMNNEVRHQVFEYLVKIGIPKEKIAMA